MLERRLLNACAWLSLLVAVACGTSNQGSPAGSSSNAGGAGTCASGACVGGDSGATGVGGGASGSANGSAGAAGSGVAGDGASGSGASGDGTAGNTATAGSAGNGSAGAAGSGASGTSSTAGASGSAGSTSSAGSSGTAGSSGSGGMNVCGSGAENANIALTCPSGLLITDVVFAGYGNPSGACGSFQAGTCNSPSAASVVKALCVGKNSCSFTVNNGTFGDPCSGTVKSADVEVSCGTNVVVGTVPFKGVANSPCAARQALKVSWYYNWTRSESEPCSDGTGGTFVPMIWGHTSASKGQNEQLPADISTMVASFVSKGQGYVLGYNEPDNTTQSNISVANAMAWLPSFDNPSIKVVTPATQANTSGQTWFKDFMAQLNASTTARADVIGLHWYGWNAGSCNASASELESYIKYAEGFAGGRPIWLTEWGCLNLSAPDVQTVVNFYNGALAVFARHPRVERYAWYPWATNCGLNNSDGSLTALGQAYAAAPAYR